MIREQTLRARQKLMSKLPVTGELLRGSLLERTVRHTKDCAKCARGARQWPAEAKVGLRQITVCDGPGGWTVQAVRRGDRRRCELQDRLEADGTGGAARGTRDHGSTRQAGDAAEPARIFCGETRTQGK